MSNGQRCCILGVCCPPDSPEQKKALAEEIAENVQLGGEGTYQGHLFAPSFAVSSFILDTYDLVPKGVGKAIVTAYGPEFAKVRFRKDVIEIAEPGEV
jgi:hypothetical protein